MKSVVSRTPPRTIRLPISKLCAKCGPGYPRRKHHRHHVEIQKCMLPWVPEWKTIYRKFRPEDFVQLCQRCHNIVHDDLYAEPMSEWWHAAYHGYRDEEMARAVASACSAAFWVWLEESSWAKRSQQLRFNPDPSKHDLLQFPPHSSSRSQ